MRKNEKRTSMLLALVIAALTVCFLPLNSNFSVQAAQPRSFDEKSVAGFYGGKTVSIIVGFAPGAGYDITARVLGKHLGNHIPGNPNVIVENRPGAGSLVAANLTYKTLRKDGTYIVTFNSQMVLQQLMDRQGIEFDGRHFNWLGSVSSSQYACGIHQDTGVTNVKQIMGPSGRVVNMGGEAPGSGITDTAAVMRAALGLKFKIIYGYSGARPVANAVLSRELDGMCISWESFTSNLKMFFEPKKMLNIVAILGSTVPEHPWLKNAVAAEAATPTEEGRRLLKIVDAPGKMVLPYAIAPGIPNDRVAALRNAFDQTLADPAFVADFNKTLRPLVARSGEEVAEIVSELLSQKPETIHALEEALKQREGP